jgi:hypothetical protein
MARRSLRHSNNNSRFAMKSLYGTGLLSIPLNRGKYCAFEGCTLSEEEGVETGLTLLLLMMLLVLFASLVTLLVVGLLVLLWVAFGVIGIHGAGGGGGDVVFARDGVVVVLLEVLLFRTRLCGALDTNMVLLCGIVAFTGAIFVVDMCGPEGTLVLLFAVFNMTGLCGTDVTETVFVFGAVAGSRGTSVATCLFTIHVDLHCTALCVLGTSPPWRLFLLAPTVPGTLTLTLDLVGIVAFTQVVPHPLAVSVDVRPCMLGLACTALDGLLVASDVVITTGWCATVVPRCVVVSVGNTSLPAVVCVCVCVCDDGCC